MNNILYRLHSHSRVEIYHQSHEYTINLSKHHNPQEFIDEIQEYGFDVTQEKDDVYSLSLSYE